jgi:hypothetical protein
MEEVSETKLPGVGVRYDFVTAAGQRIGVLVHRTRVRKSRIGKAAAPPVITTSRVKVPPLNTFQHCAAPAALSRAVEGDDQRALLGALESCSTPSAARLLW